MAIVSIDDLLDYVGLTHEDLRTRCSDEDLRKISLLTTNWEKYASLLKLPDTDAQDIHNRSQDQDEKMLLALQRWKQMFAFKATFEFLVKEVFLEVNDAEVAENVCYQLKGKRGEEVLGYPLTTRPVNVSDRTQVFVQAKRWI